MIDANSQFFAILTNVGMAKQANADALGIPWKLTEMGVGDANLTDPIPSATQTQLIREWRRRPLNQLKIDPINPAVIIAEQVIPADEGGFWIREIGLYDADGDLVAVANCAPSFKPVLSQGSGRTQVVRMNFIVSSAANITLKIDSSVVLATREYVDSKVLEELYKLDSKQSVRVATTANIALAGLQTVDGVALVAGDRVLVKNQTVAKDNGLYIVAAGVWPRALDADSSAEVTSALVVAVEQGATLADSRWQLVTDGVIILGGTALVFQDVTQGYAPINSPAFLGSPTANTATAGSNTRQLANTEFVRTAVHGTTYIDVSGSGVLTLTEAQAGTGTLSLFGALTGSRTIVVPTMPARYQVVNSTEGAFALTVKTATGSGVVVTQGRSTLLFCNGSNNIVQQQSDFDSIAMTGNPTTPTPAPGDNDKSVANTEFVQAALGVAINGAIGVNIAGSGSITPTAAQLAAGVIVLTGVLTGNRTVIVPSAVGRYHFQNVTSGAFTVTVKTAAGAGVVITQGQSSLLFCDSATVMLQQSDFIDTILRGAPQAPTPSKFDNSQKVATTAGVKAAGWQFSGFYSIIGALAGIAAHVGGLVHSSGGAGTSYSLPDSVANGLTPGATVRVQNWSTNNMLLVCQGTDKMQESLSVLSSAGTRTIPVDTYLDAIFIGGGVWVLMGPGVVAKTAPFGALLGQSGYQKLPSGLIMQWFTAQFASAFMASAFNLPIAFPTANFGCNVSMTDSAIYNTTGSPFCAGMPNGLNQVMLQSNYTASQSAVRVLAFGI